MKLLTTRLVSAAVAATICGEAHALIPVIDVQSLIQLQQQITYWQQQISAMATQIATAEHQLAATTGSRGMGALLPLTLSERNYLPPNADAIQAATTGGAPSEVGLHGAYVAALKGQAALPAAALAALSTSERTALLARRSAVAMRTSVMRAALVAASARYGQLQGLIDQIDLTVDQKGSLDLQGRIAAEQAMTSNESAKLAAVAAWSDADISAAQTLAHEAMVAAHGNFAQRFHPKVP